MEQKEDGFNIEGWSICLHMSEQLLTLWFPTCSAWHFHRRRGILWAHQQLTRRWRVWCDSDGFGRNSSRRCIPSSTELVLPKQLRYIWAVHLLPINRHSFYIERIAHNTTDLFEESKENKLEYTDVFTAYTNMVETALEQFLSSRIPVSLIVAVGALFCESIIHWLLYFLFVAMHYRGLRWKSLSK